MKELRIPISINTYNVIIYISLMLFNLLAANILINSVTLILSVFNYETKISIPWLAALVINLVIGHLGYIFANFFYSKIKSVKNKTEMDTIMIELNKSFYVGMYGISFAAIANVIVYIIIFSVINFSA